MISKTSILFVTFLTFKLVAGRSFTVVLDTTKSMDLEVDAIRANIQGVTTILANKADFENYILVPFNDADVISPMVTQKPNQLLDMLNDLRVGGGNECPEDSLSAIHRALQISQPDSYIYLFTNANAKYAHKMTEIEHLCKETGSKVVIFLSGSCSPEDLGGAGYIDVFYNIARVCSGTVFRTAVVNLRKAFNYMKETAYTDYNEVVNYNEFRGLLQFTFTVDSLTTDVLVVLSGEYPVLQISDADGYSPYMEKMIDTRQSLVVRLPNLKAGVYSSSALSQGPAHLTFYRRNRLQFEYGFSTRQPNSLRETSLRPLPGCKNYVLIQIKENENIRINELELDVSGSSLKKRVILLRHTNCDGCYIASFMVETQKNFKMTVIGKNTKTYQDILGSTKVIEVQNSQYQTSWFAPTTEILKPDTTLIDYGTNSTIVCKVVGYPKPTVWWEDDNENVLPSQEVLLEIPSVHLSVVNITKMESNFTLYCKAKNAHSEDKCSIELFVNRPYTLEVVEAPTDQEIEYQISGKLFCVVNAYPEAEIKWYHNGTEIEDDDNIYIDDEEYSLEIKNMTLDDVGNYTCEVSNEVNKTELSAVVTIGGLDAPEVSLPNELIQKPQDWVDIECSLTKPCIENGCVSMCGLFYTKKSQERRLEKGNPTPVVSWEYRPNYDEDYSSSLPAEVVVEGNKLKFSSIAVEHGGMYKCTAVNMLGEDSEEVTLKVQYAPKMLNYNENSTIDVIEGNMVELPCEVDAIPRATVKWEMYQDDVIINLPERHTTNSRHTHRFIALKEDSGRYHCIAENNLGKASKIVTVNVLVPPYIDKPMSRLVTAVTGDRVVFQCNVLYGTPVPTTMWEFIAQDSTASVLLRGTTNTTTLQLHRVSKANEGLYLCIAENDVGNDRIRIYLRIQ